MTARPKLADRATARFSVASPEQLQCAEANMFVYVHDILHWHHWARAVQTPRSGRSQRKPALINGNRPPKPDHSINAPHPTQHGTSRSKGSTAIGNELGAMTPIISEPYMRACTTNVAVPAMMKQPMACSTASGRSRMTRETGLLTRFLGL